MTIKYDLLIITHLNIWTCSSKTFP